MNDRLPNRVVHHCGSYITNPERVFYEADYLVYDQPDGLCAWVRVPGSFRIVRKEKILDPEELEKAGKIW